MIHYDPPEDHKAYLHRSGRTARAGEAGVAVMLSLWNEENDVRVIQRRLGLQPDRRGLLQRPPAGRPPELLLDQRARRRLTLRFGVARVPLRHTGHAKSMGPIAGSRVRSWPHESHLRSCQRDHRIRHPGRRRQGQGAQPTGEDVVGFGAGEPDFPTPALIVEAAVAACADLRNHKYTPAAGLPELREAIAAKTLRDSGYEVAAGQVVVTNGGKHAVTPRSSRCSTPATR